jgi:hypothetical protein
MKKTILAVALFLLLTAEAVQAGSPNGPVRHADRVLGLSRDNYTSTFYGSEWARVGVVGDGDTILVLQVYDDVGNLIEQDRGTSCAVKWVPKWTGKFTIRISNLGLVHNNYVLLTN